MGEQMKKERTIIFNAIILDAFQEGSGFIEEYTFAMERISPTEKAFNHSIYKSTKYTRTDCRNSTHCPAFRFIEQIDVKLFHQMDSVVDINDRKAHLILFNIDGRPMYCMSPKGEDVSEEVSTN